MGGGVLIAAIAIFPFTDNDAVLGYDCTDRHFSSRRCGPGKVKRTAHGPRQWKGVHGPLIAKPRKGSNGAKALYIDAALAVRARHRHNRGCTFARFSLSADRTRVVEGKSGT